MNSGFQQTVLPSNLSVTSKVYCTFLFITGYNFLRLSELFRTAHPVALPLVLCFVVLCSFAYSATQVFCNGKMVHLILGNCYGKKHEV